MSLILPFHCVSVLLTFPLFPVHHDVAGVGGTGVSRKNATVTSEFKIRVPLEGVLCARMGIVEASKAAGAQRDSHPVMAKPGGCPGLKKEHILADWEGGRTLYDGTAR